MNVMRIAACRALFAVALAAGLSVSAQAADDSTAAAQRIDALLDREVFRAASAADLAPAVDDAAFLKRVSLDLVGQRPTPAELSLFVLDPAADKRASAVKRLLADERYGRNWARYWRDVVMYRRAEDRALITSGALEDYLTLQFNDNAPWNETARDFITATGNIATEGPTGIISAQMADPNDVASETSRIFLGMQIQCAQCHDHPSDRWKREQFHEFAALFPRITLRPVFGENQMVRSFEIVSRDTGFGRGGPAQPGRGALEHYMPDLQNPAAQGKLMTPGFFLTGAKLSTGSTDYDRRSEAADWITSSDNEWFAKAIVNRYWAELIGEGFYEPIDDIGPDRVATAPETLNYLARQFVENDYNVKWLLRAIVGTRAYARESRPRRTEGGVPFAANCAQRLRGDQLLSVLGASLGFDPDAGQAENRGQRYPGFRPGLRFAFNQIFGFDPSEPRSGVTGSIPQALLMMNGRQIAPLMQATNPQSMLGRLLAADTSDEEILVELYLRCLAREPNADELGACLEHLRQSSQRGEAFEDIVWSLINSAEFVHRT